MKMCTSKGKQVAATADMEASGIVIAAAGAAQRQPRIEVTVSHAQGDGTSVKIQAVPDTGAQVCVAGPDLLTALGVKPASLTRRGILRDVANLSLQPSGSFPCRVQYGSRATVQEVFVLQSATRCYLSLQACRDLGLVPMNFPHHATIAGATVSDVGNTATDSTPPRPTSLPFPPLEENVS